MTEASAISEANACPKCGSTHIDSWSRITGYLQNIEGWNPGKIQELKDRHRYREEFKTSTALAK
jgi:anaerobic ribonucleoside-triphosphate reductase